MKTVNKKGYVYVLTNPSFREDWIKIGKSAYEVDVRSKQLDNTSTPLPFEVYATLKTEKYNEVENNLHEIFTKLADARIRKNREFFNIEPEKALKYLKQQADLLSDAELISPDDDLNKNGSDQKKYHYKGKYSVNTNELFFFYRDGTNAKMKIVGNKFILLEGSKISPTDSSEYIKKRRSEYKDKIRDFVTIQDIEFSNPSAAGILVAGGHVNGKYYWRTKDDKKLEDFITYEK